jgi:hypothetical protein
LLKEVAKMNALMSRLRREVTISLKVIREVLYGSTTYGLNRELQKEKGYNEKLFMLLMFGDLVGLPLLPPYYAMRLLPHIIPQINNWKRSVSKERDIFDILSD